MYKLAGMCWVVKREKWVYVQRMKLNGKMKARSRIEERRKMGDHDLFVVVSERIHVRVSTISHRAGSIVSKL